MVNDSGGLGISGSPLSGVGVRGGGCGGDGYALDEGTPRLPLDELKVIRSHSPVYDPGATGETKWAPRFTAEPSESRFTAEPSEPLSILAYARARAAELPHG